MPVPRPKRHINNFSQLFPPKPQWTTDHMPDLYGYTMIVTGGSSGLGKEICRVLSRNANIYLAACSTSKAIKEIEDIKRDTGRGSITFMNLDLVDPASVRHAAAEFLSREASPHVLFNNGGIMCPPLEFLTMQGHDGQFGVNVLGLYFFTQCLLSVLTSMSKSEGLRHKVHVVHTSSNGHELLSVPRGIDWTALRLGSEGTAVRRKLCLRKLYGMSKLGNVLFSNELAKRYGNDGVVSIALHPGSIKTELQRHSMSFLDGIIDNVLSYDISLRVITPLFAETSEEALNMNEKNLIACARETLPSKDAMNPELMPKLWDWWHK